MNNDKMHSGHIPVASDTKSLTIAGWLTGIYFVIELGIGFWTGSISVISDAFHTFSAVGGVLIALVASFYSQKNPNLFQTYGLIRAEIIGALFNGLFLTGMAIFVFWMGIMRLMEPIELATTPMILAAVGGLITEVIAFSLLYKRQKVNLNIKGAFLHIIQTFVGSLIIIVSAIVINTTGFLAIDPILGMAFGLVLFWASWKIIKDALNILLERTPKDLDLDKVRKAIIDIQGVVGVHHIHAWSLTSGKNIFSSHVHVKDSRNIEDIRKKIHELLKIKFKIYFSTIQVEKDCMDKNTAKEIDIV